MVTNKSKEASETGDSPFQSLTSSRYFALPSISVDLMLPILPFIPINGVYNWFLIQYILSLKTWKYFIWNALKAATCIKPVVHATAYDGNARKTRIKFNQGTKIIRDLHIWWTLAPGRNIFNNSKMIRVLLGEGMIIYVWRKIKTTHS